MPALEAVIKDLEGLAPDEILVGGDLVGRGPEGSRVVRRIADLGWPSVRGNHEDYLLDFRRQKVPVEWFEADEWAASRWMSEELTEEGANYIAALPFALTSTLDPDVRLVHGSPRSNNDGIGPWSDDRKLEEHLQSIEESVLVCAHTHRPLVRRLSPGLIVNAGSVGLPFNRDRRAQYTVLHRAERDWQVELRCVEYDLAETLEVYESSGFLKQGGITAHLLKMELEEAAPFLVPFMRWSAAHELEPSRENLDAFLHFYDPSESIAAFYRRLEASTNQDPTG